jgi:hypothetical protein
MKLYITPGSPYARVARIVVLEKGLQDRVEVIPASALSEIDPLSLTGIYPLTYFLRSLSPSVFR